MHSNICKNCNIKFERNRKRIFCSRICHYKCKYKCSKLIKKCLQCNIEFKFYKLLYKKDPNFCSLICKKMWHKTPENKIEQLKKALDRNTIKNQEECWGWKGTVSPNGYGRIWFAGKVINASRASWFVHYGLIYNKKLCVLHKCDNPICSKPDHLFLGTNKDNTRDMIKKGRKRGPKGIEVHTAKLNEEKVKQIKELLKQKMSLKYICEKFEISMTSVIYINQNKIWKHVV